MPALQAADVPDLVTATLRDLGRGKWTDLTSDTQEFHVMKKFMKGNKIVTFDEGYEFQWNVKTDDNRSARSVGLAATDVVDIRDTMTTGNHPFRHLTCNYGFELREPAFNRGKSAIFNLVESRRIDARVSMVKLAELQMWRVPTSTSTDIHGIPYWVVKNNTEGFNGGAPSGYSTVGGLSPTTYTRWKNYTGQYTAVSADDLVLKLDTAMDKTGFMPPVDMPVYNTGDAYEIYTTQGARQTMKQLAMAQNDNLGFDLDPAHGRVMFRRVPIQWIAQLDEDTTDPFYGINWGEFKLAVLKGWFMRPTRIENQPNQHTVTVVHEDSTVNPFTRNRRRHFVLATDTTMPS